MLNGLIQTPTRVQLYLTAGGGFYRDRLNEEGETSFGTNIGGGLKMPLVGPLRLRLDYRVFTLRGNPIVTNPNAFTPERTSRSSASNPSNKPRAAPWQRLPSRSGGPSAPRGSRPRAAVRTAPCSRPGRRHCQDLHRIVVGAIHGREECKDVHDGVLDGLDRAIHPP